MRRRDFLKISAAGGAAAALEGCGNPDHHLIRFVPEEDLVPGIATWKPSICTLCPAGCGLLVRVMQGEAEVIRNGQLGVLKMGLAKKLEGNPAHPVNQGRLCPRGQAGLQVTYHPDRIRHPLVRSGDRGSGQFKEATWDEALKQFVPQLAALHSGKEQLAFITAPLRGQRKQIVRQFASSFNSPVVEFAFLDGSVIREANLRSFGHAALPAVDLGHSFYVISFGADFLGTWNSPIAQARGYGEMRKGRPGQRAKFVQFESRMSLTGGNADEWIACPPGAEGAVALGVAHAIMSEKLRSAGAAGGAGNLIPGWSAGLPDYAPEAVEKQFGVSAAAIARVAREAAANGPAVALIGDIPAAQTNGLFNALAVNALNALLGSAGKPGGIQFNSSASSEIGANSIQSLASKILSGASAPKIALLYSANPVFATPPDWKVREALAKVPFIVSFGSFLDETSSLADLILPDHSPLESWLDDAPESGTTRAVASVAPPAMNPLHGTRAMPDVLLEVARQVGGETARALPWKTYDESLQAAFASLYKEKGSRSAKSADEFWSQAQQQGGWWGGEQSVTSPAAGKGGGVKTTAPQFDGAPDQYPFHFLPYASQMFYDGSLAHLPWMQEAPDPLSSAMWGTWVEINTETAGKFGIQQGDLVEVASPHGSLQAPALVTPAIAPGVIAMPIGQGHQNFTRYASGRGANPISILGSSAVAETSSLAWAATRVKVTRIGQGKLALFGASMEEVPRDVKHR